MIWIAIISLIIIGLALIVIEMIFIPGTTIVGIIGLICLIAGLIMTFNNFGTAVGWLTTGGTVVMAAGIFIYSFRSGSWKRFALNQTSSSKVNDETPISVQVGDEGVALSTLRPVGKGEFNGQIMEITSFGELVEAESKVKVARIDKRKIFVELIN